jgi:isoamylase
MKKYSTKPGERLPAGATVDSKGINFSNFSRHATSAELLLYERIDSPEPFQVITLESEINRTFFLWHVYVEGLPVGTNYTWRFDGPNDTARSGFRFNKNKELLDPWAAAVTDVLWDRKRASIPEDQSCSSMRSMVVHNEYDWEGDQPLNRPLENAIIYEMHVGGFTRHPSAKVTHPGAYAGIIEKIPYLQRLGVTHIELLPVMAFDEQDVPDGVAARGLKNYWGYSSHSFFCPHPGYCVSPEKGKHRREFRDMVKALHQAGISVILDVVFNHTAEGGADGPIINFKGMANEIFYHLDYQDLRKYRDYTGCGNTVNCNHPLVGRLLLTSLEYWVQEMHVDGFRFDLASVFARGEDGTPLYNASLPWSIEFSPILANTLLIAEAWDAGGLYQVGGFPGFRWAEWNGRYRDVMRQFVRGDRGMIGEIATRLSGSSDLYQPTGQLPINSINFITCHDGFTLYDLVSYNQKHNEGNGEDNRDGSNDNLSWNCGCEGETDKSEIIALRKRQVKNFMAILLLSQGVPMILAGDEVLSTQYGNNNCYCQDNERSWFDWSLTRKNKGVLRFVQQMIAFRKRHPCLMRKRFITGNKNDHDGLPDVAWHGYKLDNPLWTDPSAQFLACTLGKSIDDEEDIHIILNMSDTAVEAPLPTIQGKKWSRAVDTGFPSPQDILEPPDQIIIREQSYRVKERSIVVLEARQTG